MERTSHRLGEIFAKYISDKKNLNPNISRTIKNKQQDNPTFKKWAKSGIYNSPRKTYGCQISTRKNAQHNYNFNYKIENKI